MHMRAFPMIAAALLLTCPVTAQQEQPLSPDTHRNVAILLIDLLAETESCLAACTDEASVRAALPRLQELAERARALKAAQDRLPEPTTQDYMLDQALIQSFTSTWEALRNQLIRLERTGLMSDEMREILHVAPMDSK